MSLFPEQSFLFLKTIFISEYVRKYSGNTIWFFFARFCWVLQAATVGIWVTRVLGPLQLGQFNYALSVIGIFCIFTMLQCNDVLIRHIIRAPSFTPVLLGTNLRLRACLFFVSACVCLTAIPFFHCDPAIRDMLLILLLQQAFFAFGDCIYLYLTAHSLNKQQALTQITCCLLYTLLRLWAAWQKMDVRTYAWIEVANALTSSLLLLFFYQKNGGRILKWKYDRRLSRKILLCALPFLLASLSATFYSRTDIIMIQAMLGGKDVGFYSLSAKVTENITILLSMLICVFIPVLFLSAKESEEGFRKQFHRLYFLVFWCISLGLIVFLPVCSFAIQLLYGKDFLPTVLILRVFIFSTYHFGLSTVLNQWAVKTNRLMLSGLFNLAGLLINIPLNYLLIRNLGAVGGAWATLISAPAGLSLIMFSFPEGRAEIRFMLHAIVTLPSFKFTR